MVLRVSCFSNRHGLKQDACERKIFHGTKTRNPIATLCSRLPISMLTNSSQEVDMIISLILTNRNTSISHVYDQSHGLSTDTTPMGINE